MIKCIELLTLPTGVAGHQVTAVAHAMDLNDLYTVISSWFPHIFLAVAVIFVFRKYGGSIIQPM